MEEDPSLDFRRVFEAHFPRVVAYAAKLLGPNAADDVAQEVFVKVERSLKDLEDPSKLTSWIYAITLNTVRDAARRSAARRPFVVPDARGDRERDLADNDIPDGRLRTAEEIAIRNEMVACFLDHVGRLPGHYAEIYVLSEFEGLCAGDIAHRLGISVGTVKIRLHRARARLHGELRRHCACYYNGRGELMAAPKAR